jgi:hypothetical protein
MRLPRLQELGQRLLIKHGHITLPVLFGVMFLVNGLGHAFFNPTREVDIGVLELVAGVLLFVGVFLVCVRCTRAALVCYVISVGCVVITVVMQVSILIRQVSTVATPWQPRACVDQRTEGWNVPVSGW